MDTASKIVLGFIGCVGSVCLASCVRVGLRAKKTTAAMDQMEAELNIINWQYNEGDISRPQAERAIDVVVDKYKAIYMTYSLDKSDEVRDFFEKHREGKKKLLGFPA
jgi:hypothetical protein